MSEVQSQGTSVESSGGEPIAKTGSSADITSFDELEGVMDAPKSRKAIDNSESGSKPAKSQEKAKPKAPTKKEAKDSEQTDDEGGSDEDQNESDSEKSKDSKSEVSKKEDGKQSEEKSSVKPKVIKVKSGDQEIDLRSDTQFEVVVDGKKVPVTAQELLNEFSGKTNWTKKYQELDTREKSFQNEKQAVESGIKNWVELTKTNPEAAIEYVCDISGLDPRKFTQELRNQMLKSFEEYSQLSPEERQQRELSEERDYYKSKAEKDQAERVLQREKSELDKRVQATISQHDGLTNAKFVSCYDELKNLVAKGVVTGPITPELVGAYYQQIEQHRLVGEIVTEVSPELENKLQAEKDLKSIWDNDPSLTVTDIKKIAAEVYGSDAAKRLAKKVKKSQPVAQAAPKAKPSYREEPISFDEL